MYSNADNSYCQRMSAVRLFAMISAAWPPLPVLRRCLVSLWLAQTLAVAQSISNIAGTGVPGSSGDGAPAVSAQLNNPFGITRGPDGLIYLVEFDGNVIRRISRDGIITTIAGCGKKGGAGDGGPALKAEFNQPHEIRFDKDGHLYVSDMLNHRIRKIDAKTQRISTIAGTGAIGFSGDGGLATEATLNNPIAIQLDAEGDLFICDIGNHRIRRVEIRSGRISTIAGTGKGSKTTDGAAFASVPLNGPRTLDFDAEGNMWVALREGNQVWKLERSTGIAHWIAGTGQKGFSGNGGPAKLATLSGPKGIAVAPDGTVYVADTESHSIRKIDPKRGTIHAVVGNGQKGDGPVGEAISCQLARPHGVYVDKTGDVFVGDSENHRVRVVKR